MVRSSARLFLFLLLGRSVSSFQLLVYGLGNVGREVTKEVSKDWIVRGTKRNPAPDDGIAIPFSDASKYLSDASHVLITIPLTPEIFPIILKDLSEHLAPSSGWVGFVSTTGVYGNHDGAWVTEDSPLLCESTALEYVRFEQELMELAAERDWSAAIFRCAGLYGPDRSALHTLWKRGIPAVRGAPCFITNRIHETDVARAIVSAMEKESSGIYNLADDEPEARTVAMDYAVELLRSNGMTLPASTTVPKATTASSSKRETRRKNERKLVDNGKMKSELVENLVYPTYREGLSSILADRSNPWWN